MIYFTKYAEQKFELLNAHKVYIRKEEVERVVASPEKSGRIGTLVTAEAGTIKVVYQKEPNLKKIITFYPV